MSLNNPRILCVDDGPLNLSLLDGILSSRGYDVVLAANGPEALEKIRTERIDLCLLDVMMPEMNGFDVCRLIKSDKKHDTIAVVMITSLDDKENRILGIEAGAADFISKPFDAEVVLARIKMLLHVKSLNDELATANIELEAFNYSVSHDLRSPLTVISGYCQVVRKLCGDGDSLDGQCIEYINIIYEHTKRMNQLIDTLLNFSRVKHSELRLQKVDLSRLAREVAVELHLLIPERLITFIIAEGISTHGDEALLRVVLDNLIGNAWKYIDCQDGAIIEFGVNENEQKPVFFVRDNGQGFDMSYADTLFTPFQRIPGTTAKGHGIGLATVERIVRRHGGRIWAESQVDKGATFFFTLE